MGARIQTRFRTLIVGLGSPHGDDRAGWSVVKHLEAEPLPNVRVRALSDPCRLWDHLDACDRLIVVDAMRGPQPAGTIVRFNWPDPAIDVCMGRSCHGVGLGAILALAEQLGNLPAETILFGIAGHAWKVGESMSAAVAQSLSELCRRLRQVSIERLPTSHRLQGDHTL